MDKAEDSQAEAWVRQVSTFFADGGDVRDPLCGRILRTRSVPRLRLHQQEPSNFFCPCTTNSPLLKPDSISQE
jgi:hypothetical protein